MSSADRDLRRGLNGQLRAVDELIQQYRERVTADSFGAMQELLRVMDREPERAGTVAAMAVVWSVIARNVARDAGQALDEGVEWQNTVTHRMPDGYDADEAQTAIIDRWLDDMQRVYAAAHQTRTFPSEAEQHMAELFDAVDVIRRRGGTGE
jgi:hypothetical protein